MEDWKAIQVWRKAERARLIERRMATPLAERRGWSAPIELHLERLIGERAPRIIGFYWPFKAEFDARPLIRRLLASGSQAALPVVLAPKTAMEFRLWHPDTAMATGVYAIPYPAERNVVVPDLVLAPLVGFDAAKYRLGYGGGYFDRTLAVLQPRPFAIGIGFEFARLATVEPQPHDLAMDAIVTESGVF
ncbi:MAG TPA: 5-formyltetrahydrofolate cyclo-ligase [Stellaceae bacterium]|jgi:5-formyltetrahydrofolate cyclo-ligase|nr:5-formyltetrahydrofolate cyclo-ligase [Stellaceae bacterium]